MRDSKEKAVRDFMNAIASDDPLAEIMKLAPESASDTALADSLKKGITLTYEDGEEVELKVAGE